MTLLLSSCYCSLLLPSWYPFRLDVTNILDSGHVVDVCCGGGVAWSAGGGGEVGKSVNDGRFLSRVVSGERD